MWEPEFISFFIGVWLVYNVVLVSTLQCSESCKDTYIPSLFNHPPTSQTPSHPPPCPTPLGHHRALSWIPWAIHQLPTSYHISYTAVYIYMSVLLSQFVSSSPSLLCPHTHSLCLCLYSCPANRFICTIFLEDCYLIKMPISRGLSPQGFTLQCSVQSDHKSIFCPHYCVARTNES